MSKMNLIYMAIPVALLFIAGVVSAKWKIENRINDTNDYYKTIFVNLFMILVIALCFFKMPYSYFGFLKFAILFGGFYNALAYGRLNRLASILLSSIIAIIFNPLIQFSFKKSEWHKIDILVMGILLTLAILDAVALRKERQIISKEY